MSAQTLVFFRSPNAIAIEGHGAITAGSRFGSLIRKENPAPLLERRACKRTDQSGYSGLEGA
jgi:hypothetical protein